MSIVLKISVVKDGKSDKYRKRVDRTGLNLERLHNVVLGIVPEFGPSDSVTYVDTDGDEILIKTDEDLVEARVVMTEKTPRRESLDIFVKVARTKKQKEDRKQKQKDRCHNWHRQAQTIDVNLHGNRPFDIALDIFSNEWQTVLQKMLANPQFAAFLRKFASALDETQKPVDIKGLMKQLWHTKEMIDLVGWLQSRAPELAPVLARIGEILSSTESNAHPHRNGDSMSSSSTDNVPKRDVHGGHCNGNRCLRRNRRGQCAAPLPFEDELVHTHVTCDISGMCPIRGIRYHKVGFDYDLCEAEFAKLTDSEKAKFEKITEPQLIHPNVSCDGCGQAPLLGKRYKMIGSNYDLCESDFAKLPNHEKSKYVVIDSMVTGGSTTVDPRTIFRGRRHFGGHQHFRRTTTAPPAPVNNDIFPSKNEAQKCEDDLQKAIAESLAMSERVLATRKQKEEEIAKQKEETSAKLTEDVPPSMSDSLIADLAAVEAKMKGEGVSSNMSESLIVDLAAVDEMKKDMHSIMSESLVADLTAIDTGEQTPSVALDTEVEMKKSDGNLARYVQTFVHDSDSQLNALCDNSVSSSGITDKDRITENFLNMGTMETDANICDDVDASTSPPQMSPPKALHVCDISCPDKSEIPRDSTFHKTWRFRNDGAAIWPVGTSISYVTGDFEGFSQTLIDLPAPGCEVDVTITLKAPSRVGRYVGYFRLATPQPDSQRFGHRVWVDVMITEPISPTLEDSFTIIEAPEEYADIQNMDASTGLSHASSTEKSNKSVDTLSRRFEELAQESSNMLNQPVDTTEDDKETTEVDNGEHEYEDDFENDDESPRNRPRDKNLQKSLGSVVESVSPSDLAHNTNELPLNNENSGSNLDVLPIDKDELLVEEDANADDVQTTAFIEEIQTLSSMGFYDLEAVHAALVASEGNLQGALDNLLR
jgi:hypothetical protein